MSLAKQLNTIENGFNAVLKAVEVGSLQDNLIFGLQPLASRNEHPKIGDSLVSNGDPYHHKQPMFLSTMADMPCVIAKTLIRHVMGFVGTAQPDIGDHIAESLAETWNLPSRDRKMDCNGKGRTLADSKWKTDVNACEIEHRSDLSVCSAHMTVPKPAGDPEIRYGALTLPDNILMFIGSVNRYLRAMLEMALRHSSGQAPRRCSRQAAQGWPGGPDYVACSGNFTVEWILARCGTHASRRSAASQSFIGVVHSNDV